MINAVRAMVYEGLSDVSDNREEDKCETWVVSVIWSEAVDS